jgi:hypothetical protein
VDTRVRITTSLAIAVAGCADFATPAELDRPQILAIASEPASLEPGARARLSILVAGPEGEMEVGAVSWRVAGPALGRIEEEAGEVYYRAPSAIDEDPAGTLVEATARVDGAELVGVKAMVIGAVELANPAVSAIEANGQPIGEALVIARGERVELTASLQPAASGDEQLAWYSNRLVIEKYRDQPTEAVAPEEAGDGWLFAVARDRGGVGWRAVPVVIE